VVVIAMAAAMALAFVVAALRMPRGRAGEEIGAAGEPHERDESAAVA
jgi:hypothetical protein